MDAIHAILRIAIETHAENQLRETLDQAPWDDIIARAGDGATVGDLAADCLDVAALVMRENT